MLPELTFVNGDEKKPTTGLQSNKIVIISCNFHLAPEVRDFDFIYILVQMCVSKMKGMNEP